MSDRYTLKLIKTDRLAYAGLTLLRLQVLDGDKQVAIFDTVSGQPRHQVFHTDSESKEGSMEPLGQGEYDVGGIHWAGEPWSYEGEISRGLGFAAIHLVDSQTKRSALEIHWDANRQTSPGTAGCIGLPTAAEMIQLLQYFKDEKRSPKKLVVAYGL